MTPSAPTGFAAAWLQVTVLAAVSMLAGLALATALPSPALNDWPVLHRWGSTLIGGNLDVYVEDPRLNVGPLALLVAGLLPSREVAAGVGAAILPVAMALVTPRLGGRFLASFAVAFFPWVVAGAYGHIDDQLAVLFLAGMTTGSVVAGGLWLGAAVVAKPWAVLGAGVLRPRGLLVAAATIVALALPFALSSGIMDVGRFVIGVQDGALLSFVTDEIPGWWRELQLAAMLAIVIVLRRNPLAAITAGVTVRLALDPGDFPYYAAGLAGLGACLASRSGVWSPLAASWLLLLAPALPGEPAVRAAAFAVALMGCIRTSRTGRPADRKLVKVPVDD